MKEIYVSIDIEADGRIPGFNNMLSFGAAVFDLTAKNPRTPVSTFEANLELVPGCTGDKDTMEWWATQPEAWAAHRKNLQRPEEVMPKFVDWLQKLPGSPVVVGFPITYDFMFLYWYMMRYGGAEGKTMAECNMRSPFSHSGVDIKTAAWLTLGGRFRDSTKKNWPRLWSEGAPRHDHTALQDAIGQGVQFVNILEYRG